MLLEDEVLRVYFHRSERWGLRFSVGESFFFDVVDFLRGGVCRRPGTWPDFVV